MGPGLGGLFAGGMPTLKKTGLGPGAGAGVAKEKEKEKFEDAPGTAAWPRARLLLEDLH